ncbi:PI15-like protein [Mya arenaria]|uniref:PI15-like protein n=1 Tax=Mya arenaria TaxID=6604 RepID=A0ABY7FVE3_MYAAR|nr:PI15-like protein [Mya arenaria]
MFCSLLTSAILLTAVFAAVFAEPATKFKDQLLVWSQTREVGCAIKKCPSMSGMGQHVKDAWYIGCWYDPKGNDMAEFPYLSGAACSACLEGQTCEDGLCAGVGKEKCEDKSPRKDCVMWEASGNCQSNKPYMEKNCRQSCGFCTGGKRSIYEDMESRMLADRAVDTGDCKDTRADCYDLRTSCSDSNVRADCPVTCDTCPSSRRSNLARGLLRELMMADRTVDTGDCKDTRADCHDLRTSCSNSAALRADCPVTCDTCPSSRRSDLAPLLARAALLEDLMLADRAVDTGACQDKRSDCHDQRMKCGSDPDLRKNCPVTCDTCPAQ